MNAAVLLAELRHRGAIVQAASGRLVIDAPKGTVTPELRETLIAHKVELVRLLLLGQVEATFKPGEWLAYRDDTGRLVTAKYAGSTEDSVLIWLADGATRTIPPEAVALDWCPDAAEMFEERLAIMLDSGVAEDVARLRAEQCAREYLDRLAGGVA